MSAGGFLPVYWKLLKHVPTPELLSHRVAWSFVTLLIFLGLFAQAGRPDPPSGLAYLAQFRPGRPAHRRQLVHLCLERQRRLHRGSQPGLFHHPATLGPAGRLCPARTSAAPAMGSAGPGRGGRGLPDRPVRPPALDRSGAVHELQPLRTGQEKELSGRLRGPDHGNGNPRAACPGLARMDRNPRRRDVSQGRGADGYDAHGRRGRPPSPPWPCSPAPPGASPCP